MAKVRLLTMSEFCLRMVCRPQDVFLWMSEGMPHHKDNKFDLKECQEWHRIGYWMQRKNGGIKNV